MIHVVTLERNPVRAMPLFVQALGKWSYGYRRLMGTTWLVDTWLDGQTLAQTLREFIIKQDFLFVARLNSLAQEDYGGFLKKDSWEWIKARRDDGSFG